MKLSILCGVGSLLAVWGAHAQNIDSSGNSSLNGSFFVRQISLTVDHTTGLTNAAYCVYGTIVFDGNGNYTFNGQLASAGSAGVSPYSVSGVYSVQSNGIAALQSLLDNSANIFGAVAQGVFSGSSTQSAVYADEMVAIPAGTSSSLTALKGAYNFGTIEFLQSDLTARDSYFTINADGNGNIAAFTLNGAAANQNNANVTQTVSATTYSLTGNGTGTWNLPAGDLIANSKVFYISSDGNFVIAGGFDTFDLEIGIRASAMPANNATFSGVYFVTGLETNAAGLNAFAGSINATGAGESLWHLRVNSLVNGSYSNTHDLPYSVTNGSISQPTAHYSFALSGQAFVVVGTGPEYQLSLGLHAPQYSGAGVYLNPLGIVNAANLAPITNPVSPGEFVSLFGTGLASGTAQAQSLPISTLLGGVQVLVNGTFMPVQYVSSTQINALVPFELDVRNSSFATFQVIDNGIASNSVSVFSAATSPGVFSINQTGTGPAAVLHADYTPVSSASPAKAGETVQLFLAGLGTVTPNAGDGAAGSGNPLNLVNARTSVQIGGQSTKASVAFSGLAPGFAGLYQVNFVIPSGLTSGNNSLTISTPQGITSQTMIAISN